MEREKLRTWKKKSSGAGSSTPDAVHPPLMMPEVADVVGNAVTETPAGVVPAAMVVPERPRQQDADGEGEGGDEEGEGEETDEELQGFDQFDHLQIQEIGAESNPKLADGFYEIEALRKKRSRKLCNDCDLCDVYTNFVGVSACGSENSNAAKKGELQYLIKWRGWPETSNTWEPLENLQSCTDVIDAFEESLQSGKQRSTRKRKRKYGGLHTQTKKKQRDSPSTGTSNAPAPKGRVIDKPVPFGPLTLATIVAENIVDGVNENVEMVNQATENTIATQSAQREEEREINLRLSDLKGTFPNSEANGDKLGVHGRAICVLEGDCSANDPPRLDGAEPAQAVRCMGAKRRKSGSVKRFKQDSASSMAIVAQSETARLSDGLCGSLGWQGMQNPNLVGNDLRLENKFDISNNMGTITKILKAVKFRPAAEPGKTEEGTLIFMAMRSDGIEVEVDNKYLKANYPLLLIDFYEKHLRYNEGNEFTEEGRG